MDYQTAFLPPKFYRALFLVQPDDPHVNPRFAATQAGEREDFRAKGSAADVNTVVFSSRVQLQVEQ